MVSLEDAVIARLETGGHRFEILVDPNEAQAFKEGDEIDWEEEIRLFVEERVSFSPDALTGLEANTRFAGPETMETKIFGRLTAWQNWIFQRANAVGEAGALSRYGSGKKVNFDRKRV